MNSGKIKAKKSLGQHFLFNQDYLERIIKFSITDYNDIDDVKTILEIGPGLGTLTSKISAAAGNAEVICIEKDLGLQEKLIQRWKNVSCIFADALNIDWHNIQEQKHATGTKNSIVHNADNNKHAGNTFDKYISRAASKLNTTRVDMSDMQNVSTDKEGADVSAMKISGSEHVGVICNQAAVKLSVSPDAATDDATISRHSKFSIKKNMCTDSKSEICLETAISSSISSYTHVNTDNSTLAPLSETATHTLLIANLPYNISAPLIIDFITQRFAKRYCILVQKEMAQRVCAKVNEEHYGRLAVLAQAYCNVRMCFDIPGDVFKPRTKVMSTFLIIEPKDNQKNACEKKLNATDDTAADSIYECMNIIESQNACINRQIELDDTYDDAVSTITHVSQKSKKSKNLNTSHIDTKSESHIKSPVNKTRSAKALDSMSSVKHEFISIEEFEKLDQLVKACFSQRRKMLNNLILDEWKPAFHKYNVDLTQRAENISVDTYIRIAKEIK